MSFPEVVDAGVCAANRFRAAGVAAGIKKSGDLDLALIISDLPASAAGVFTTNRAAAAPVQVSRQRVAVGFARGVVANSGCANACTGSRGHEDAVAMAEEAARAAGVDTAEMLVCSTGKIGEFLPIAAVTAGIAQAAASLTSDDEQAMRAIMTTDTRPKRAAVRHPDGWALGGIAKGAGMIAPDMATMLAFMTIDAAVDPHSLQEILGEAVADTFNAITVDGDTSTNDTVLVFANGASGVSPKKEQIHQAMLAVCTSLADQIVADGEGATKLVRVRVTGAASRDDARKAARAVAESLLVKTAMFGGDPNWGRVAAAIGYSGAGFDLKRVSIHVAGHELFSKGEPAGGDSQHKARAALAGASQVTILCELGAGDAAAEIATTDLTPGYVELNAGYET